MNFLFNRYIILLLDTCFVVFSFWLSFFVRSEFQFELVYKSYFLTGILPLTAIQTLVFLIVGTHRLSLMRITFEDTVRLLMSIVLGTLIGGLVLYVWPPVGYPRSIFVLYPLILSGMVISLRFLGRIVHERRNRHRKKKATQPLTAIQKTIVIAGAGTSGIQLVRSLRHQTRIRIIGFLDDDPLLQGKELCNLPILGTCADATAIATKSPFHEIIIAMPSASGETMKRMLSQFRPLGVPIKTLPNLTDFVEGKNPATQLRSINLEDLLRREPVILDLSNIQLQLQGKTVLVSGAAGSIGSELCRQITLFGPRKVLMLDIAESPLYEIECELSERQVDVELLPVLLDIKDLTQLERVFGEHRPEIVFHAAAYKHVPMVEMHPISGVINNVLGGKNIADLCHRYQAERMVLISSDKAVNPTNLMGATKRILECYYSELNGSSTCRFVAVRFGNVLGSKGSLIPIFERQLKQGGPLTVTHRDITRFFMTIPEATQLVLQAASMGRGGEIFVLDMGEPIKIYDLARDFIELHGFEVGRDVSISIVGLRPGEKLYEELFAVHEQEDRTSHPKIMVARQKAIPHLGDAIDGLIELAQSGQGDLAKRIKELIPEYTPFGTKPPIDRITQDR